MDMHYLPTKRPIDKNISAFVVDEYCDIPNPTNSIIDVKHIPSLSALVTSWACFGLFAFKQLNGFDHFVACINTRADCFGVSLKCRYISSDNEVF